MLDTFLQFLSEFFEHLMPLVRVLTYERGVLMRGEKVIELRPGWHWKVPVYDAVDRHPVVDTTLSLPAQSMVTLDKVAVIAKGCVKYRISDIIVYGTKVNDAIDALGDTACGIIFATVRSMRWDDVCHTDLSETITEEVKKAALEWGIDVEKVTLTDLSNSRSLRIINEQSLKKD